MINENYTKPKEKSLINKKDYYLQPKTTPTTR